MPIIAWIYFFIKCSVCSIIKLKFVILEKKKQCEHFLRYKFGVNHHQQMTKEYVEIR